MTDKDTSKSKILIVDDEGINIMSLARILKPQYDVIVAIDGYSAIEAAEKHIPDIILLDIIMPEMDGFDVLVKLKNSESTKNIPVIFITGLDNTEDEERGFTLGAVDYITKPFHNLIVKARVKTHLRMSGYMRTIERLSMMDTLTELPNRRSFDNRIDIEWKHAVRNKSPISILMIDVDKFKVYNDTYGHPQGDILLRALSKVLKQTLRRTIDFASRWGGEEFAILLPGTDSGGASVVAENIRKNIETTEVLCVDGTKTFCTISVGVNSVTPLLYDTVDSFIAAADKALYTAKNSGRNRICLSPEYSGR